jgi:hypothetical protein
MMIAASLGSCTGTDGADGFDKGFLHGWGVEQGGKVAKIEVMAEGSQRLTETHAVIHKSRRPSGAEFACEKF